MVEMLNLICYGLVGAVVLCWALNLALILCKKESVRFVSNLMYGLAVLAGLVNVAHWAVQGDQTTMVAAGCVVLWCIGVAWRRDIKRQRGEEPEKARAEE